MPKPTHQSSRPLGARTQKKSVFGDIFRNRAERRRQREEEAAKAISNNRAENENRIIDTLAGINFVSCKLPQDILAHKTNPEQKWCDLEYACRALQSTLRKPSYFEVSTEAIDAKLLLFAGEFANAVANGNVKAAYAAKNALLTGVEKIRNRIPHIQPDLVQGFIDSSVKYLETWVGLIDNSRIVDELEKNIENEKKKDELNAQALEQAKVDLKNDIQADVELLQALDDIQNQTEAMDSVNWTPQEKKVHKMLTDMRFRTVEHGLSTRLTVGQENRLRKHESMVNALDAKVGILPIPEDPDNFNKYNEEIEAVFNDLAMIDTEVDEYLTLIEDIEGRMASLDNAPGAIHARNMLADQAEAFIKELQDQQEKEVAGGAANKEALMRKLGIRSEEEQQAMVKQAEEIRAQQMAVLAQQAAEMIAVEETVNETQSEVLYN